MKPFLLILLLFVSIQTALTRPAKVILLRHAEKPLGELDIHLSERGQARARALVPFLTTQPVFLTSGQPVALFAPLITRNGHSRRPFETLKPLADHLKLNIQKPYGAKDYGGLAKRILEDPSFNGKTVVICWVHDYLPALAKELGVKPKPAPWKGDVYDRVWVITFDDHRATLVSLPQNLLPGDSAK